jgi:hypothetical protein
MKSAYKILVTKPEGKRKTTWWTLGTDAKTRLKWILKKNRIPCCELDLPGSG